MAPRWSKAEVETFHRTTASAATDMTRLAIDVARVTGYDAANRDLSYALYKSIYLRHLMEWLEPTATFLFSLSNENGSRDSMVNKMDLLAKTLTRVVDSQRRRDEAAKQ